MGYIKRYYNNIPELDTVLNSEMLSKKVLSHSEEIERLQLL